MTIPLNAPSLGALEEEYVLDALRSGWVTTGRYVELFEEDLARRTGRAHVVACSSGTAALYLALRALDPSSSVLIPAYTCDAVCNAAIMASDLKPVIADAEPETFGLDVAHKALGGVGAVVLAHCYGVPARDSYPLERACQALGIPLIEDASEAHGARYADGRPAGKLGTVSVMSFRGEKTVSGGQLGAVLTDDPALARRARQWAHNGLPCSKVRFWATAPGLNMQPSHLNCALAYAQLERLEELVKCRNAVHERWRGLFPTDQPRAVLFQSPGPHTPAWWLTAIRTDAFTPMLPQDLGAALAERGIETRPGFYPLSWFPHVAQESVHVPVAERLLRTLLILPSGPDITEAQQAEVVKAIGEITGAW